MKRTAALCISILAMGAGSVPAFANPHAHQGHVNAAYPAPARLTLDQGRKWATDEALRRHMGELRGTLVQQRQAISPATSRMPRPPRWRGASNAAWPRS